MYTSNLARIIILNVHDKPKTGAKRQAGITAFFKSSKDQSQCPSTSDNKIKLKCLQVFV